MFSLRLYGDVYNKNYLGVFHIINVAHLYRSLPTVKFEKKNTCTYMFNIRSMYAKKQKLKHKFTHTNILVILHFKFKMFLHQLRYFPKNTYVL